MAITPGTYPDGGLTGTTGATRTPDSFTPAAGTNKRVLAVAANSATSGGTPYVITATRNSVAMEMIGEVADATDPRRTLALFEAKIGADVTAQSVTFSGTSGNWNCLAWVVHDVPDHAVAKVDSAVSLAALSLDFDDDGIMFDIAFSNVDSSGEANTSISLGGGQTLLRTANRGVGTGSESLLSVSYKAVTAGSQSTSASVTNVDGTAHIVVGYDEAVAAVTPAKMASASVMRAPAVTVDGEVTPAKMASASVMRAPALVSSVLTLLPDDADAVSYDTGTTLVDGTTLYLEGTYDGFGFGGWVNTNAPLADGIDGYTYAVVLDASGKQTPGAPAGNNNATASPWAPVKRFKHSGVWGAWSKLTDYAYNSTTKVIAASLIWAVAPEAAQVAYKPVMTVAELDAFRAEIYDSPYAIETNSSAAASSLPIGVHARLDHGTGPNSVAAGTVDLWGARIGTGPMVGLVVFCEHAQEDVGDLSAMQFIRWMLGASSEAADFRSRFSTYVYVHNLSGRKCGRTRYNQDVGTDEDPNRAYEGTASEQTNALKAAIELDIPVASVQLAWLLAYHGQQDANVNTAAIDIYTTTEFAADQQFYTRVAAAVGSTVHRQDTATADLQSGTSRKFGHIARGAQLSLTLEHADAAPGYPDPAAMYDTFAAATGETLIDLADEGYFGGLVTPAKMASASVMRSPSVAAYGAVTAGAMASASVMRAPAVTAAGTVTPAKLLSSSAMRAPSVDAYASVAPGVMASASAMRSPAVTAAGAALPGKMVSASAMRAPTVAAYGDVAPGAMVSASAMRSPAVTAVGAALPGKMVSASAMHAPSVATHGSLTPARMVSASAMRAPTLAVGGGVAPGRMMSVSAMRAPGLSTYGAVTPGTMMSVSRMGSPIVGLPPVPPFMTLTRRGRSLTMTRSGRLAA